MPHPVSFEIKLQKACGIDMHEDSMKVCFMSLDKSPQHKSFGTTTNQLKLLCQQLTDEGITDAVIESTGIYWIPLFW